MGTEATKTFSNDNVLAWMGLFAEMMDVGPEQFKVINLWGKQ